MKPHCFSLLHAIVTYDILAMTFYMEKSPHGENEGLMHYKLAKLVVNNKSLSNIGLLCIGNGTKILVSGTSVKYHDAMLLS